jgi:hypothetical protein
MPQNPGYRQRHSEPGVRRPQGGRRGGCRAPTANRLCRCLRCPSDLATTNGLRNRCLEQEENGVAAPRATGRSGFVSAASTTTNDKKTSMLKPLIVLIALCLCGLPGVAGDKKGKAHDKGKDSAADAHGPLVAVEIFVGADREIIREYVARICRPASPSSCEKKAGFLPAFRRSLHPSRPSWRPTCVRCGPISSALSSRAALSYITARLPPCWMYSSHFDAAARSGRRSWRMYEVPGVVRASASRRPSGSAPARDALRANRGVQYVFAKRLSTS